MIVIPDLQHQPVLSWPQKEAVMLLERMERRLQQERETLVRWREDAEAMRRQRAA